MNTNKKVLLVVLLLLVGSLCISTVNAKTYTKTVKFKDHTSNPVIKSIGKGDFISTYYNSKYSPQFGKKRAMSIVIANEYYHDDVDAHYKMISSKVKFTKKVNGKTKTATKTYKPNKWGSIDKQAPNGWKPYSAVITYKNI